MGVLHVSLHVFGTHPPCAAVIGLVVTVFRTLPPQSSGQPLNTVLMLYPIQEASLGGNLNRA